MTNQFSDAFHGQQILNFLIKIVHLSETNYCNFCVNTINHLYRRTKCNSRLVFRLINLCDNKFSNSLHFFIIFISWQHCKWIETTILLQSQFYHVLNRVCNVIYLNFSQSARFNPHGISYIIYHIQNSTNWRGMKKKVDWSFHKLSFLRLNSNNKKIILRHYMYLFLL